jgi:hypothetical protein
MKTVILMIALFLLVACAQTTASTQILIAANCDAPEMRTPYNMLLESVVQQLESRVEIATITGRGGNNPIEAANLRPNSMGNPIKEAKRIGQARVQLLTRVSQRLRQAHTNCSDSSEIIAEINAAAQRLPSNAGRLIIISHGFEQSTLANFYDWNLPPNPQVFLKHLAKKRLIPKLQGVNVCMLGITSGNDNNARGDLAWRVRGYWEAFFERAGANLEAYGFSDCGNISSSGP